MALGGRSKRLSELQKVPAFAAMDHRNILNPGKESPLLSGLNREERRASKAGARRLASEYNKIINRITKTGAGFPIDRIIHELCIEYTNRYATSGLYNMPLNFNYFESFCEIKLIPNSVAPYAEPAKEIDHLFSTTDFLDYATSTESNGFNPGLLIDLPEDIIFNFTANGDLSEYTFIGPNGKDFLFSGFSMVRRGYYLSWCIVGGEIYSSEEWSTMIAEKQDFKDANSPPWKARFLAESASRFGGEFGTPVSLEGTTHAQRTILAGEMDLITQRHLGRCYMLEWENTFDVVCDDPDIFSDIENTNSAKEILEIQNSRFWSAAVLWSLAETMLQLPAYFAFKINITKTVSVSAGKKLNRTGKKSGNGIGAYYKSVSSIEFVPDHTTPIRSYIPRHYEFETGGFWRRISQDSTGTGPHGEKTTGKTWIKTERPPSEKPQDINVIYVKSTIAAARIEADKYINSVKSAIENINFDNNTEKNVLYVLRCIVMNDNVYKVGWTSGTAEERAKQISAATGVPDSFVVVAQWHHPQSEALEKNIHALLDPYRVSNNREFFRIELDKIKKIISNEITRIAKISI